MNVPDLTFPKIPYGTHNTPWDLKILLYKGAARIRRGKASALIRQSKLGTIEAERIPLVISFHEVFTSLLNGGRSVFTVISYLETLWLFYSWADKAGACLTKTEIVDTFRLWSESIIERLNGKKDISPLCAYKGASKMAVLISRALNHSGKNPGGKLMLLTRLRKPNNKKRVLGHKAEKQNLADTFNFGHILTKICDSLDVVTVRGPLPIIIHVDGNKKIVVAGGVEVIDFDTSVKLTPSAKKRFEQCRVPLSEEDSLLSQNKRTGILNLRIQSELLIFIAQTGMNLMQAANLRRENYRWQSDGDDLDVFRVYKGRRHGEAIFRCFKAYREHLERYIQWLDETKLSTEDDRLFPLVSRGIIRANGSRPTFRTLRDACEKIDVNFIGAQALRRTRVNWLLRRSQDPNLTADQMAHNKEVLLRVYEQPHHQQASREIIKFHSSTDPTYSPPGPGVCVDSQHKPAPVPNCPDEAPKPDCISPEGCLFCVNHRDVMSADYCWKLTSHAQIKLLEVNLHKQSQKKAVHPANHVIDRIQNKLAAIAKGSEVRAQWVRDVQDAVRAGKYHPIWEGHIRLMESFA